MPSDTFEKPCQVNGFYFYGLTGPTTQFLNDTQELFELVLERMALLMDIDQNRSVLSLQWAKALEFGVAGTHIRAPWTFPFKLARSQTGQKKVICRLCLSSK